MTSRTVSRKSDISTPESDFKAFLGCDTETYYEGDSKGLLSIQVHGSLGKVTISKLFTASTYETSDLIIRLDICKQFFDWLESFSVDIELAFFNIDFDMSQMILYICRYSGYKFVYDDARYWYLPKGHIQILESDTNMYSVSLRTFRGRLVHMVDLSNFLPGVSLDAACRSWIGRGKVAIESKRFLKRRPEGIEVEYSMEDARLTYDLMMELRKEGVIENQRTVTIAGRTIRHFQDYLMENYHCTFDVFFYPGMSKDEISECKQHIEEVMRPSVRGGITMAVHTGMFEDCRHIDARSMYPTQCIKPWIPVGEILEERPEGPCFELVFPSGYFTLKEGCIPYFQWRSHWQCDRYHYIETYEPGEYVKDCMLDGSLYLWGEEWDLIQGCYDCDDVEITKTLYIRAIENVALKGYVRELYTGKSTSTGSRKLFFKGLLNSLYGKFLTRPDGTVIHYIDGQRVKVDEDGRRTFYLPLGSWIAMGGRVTLHKTMSSIPVDNVLYCDTDSIIYKGDKDPDISLGPDLGQWAVESEGIDAWIVGPKAYQERYPDGTVNTKCAGMPKAVAAELPFGDLREGLECQCFKPRRDPLTMAINIEPTVFTVSTRATIFKSR